MLLRKLWPLLCFSFGLTCSASTKIDSARIWERQSSLLHRDQQLWKLAIHDSKFAAIPHVSALAGCADNQLPEPIATPNPLLGSSKSVRISISVIVGTDGRVHSPLILEGAGRADDGTTLSAILSWKYRPATCNGVPTEAEGTIQFSTR